MAAHRDKESLSEEVWNLKKALQAARESNRLLTLQNKHMVADLKKLEEHVIDLQSAKREQRSTSPLRGGATSSSAEQSALVARLKQQAREIKSQQVEIASELAQIKGSTRAHRFREIEEENRALYAEIKRLTDALRGQKALFEKERTEWKKKVEGLEKRAAERRPLRREPARGPSPVDSVYSRGNGVGRQRDASPSKSSKRELEMETIRGQCDRLQESNQNLVAELQEVKEYVQFLSQASVPSNHFQTRPVSPQPSDWLHLEPSEPSNVANSTDSRTMAGEAWESKVPDAATDGSNFPAAGHAEANGKTSPELKAKREEKPSGSKRTGLREESEESLSKNEGPESNSGYASVESGTASNLVEGGETERLSTPTETERLSTPTEPERRWGTEDQMRVKHVAAEERQWATGTEQNEDSVSPEEPLSLKKESSLKKVGFAPEAAGEVSATEWRKAERLQMEVLGIGQSSKYSASQKGGEVYQAVRSVREEDKIVFEDLVKVGQNRVEIAGNRVEKGSVKAAQKTEKGVDEGIQEVRGVAKKMEKAVESRLEETGRKADGSDGSGMSGSNVERSAVGAVEEGMGDRRWGAEKAVEKGKVTASGVVRTAETIVAKRVEEVVEAGRSLEQSTGQTRVEIAEIAWKADSSARQGGEIEVEEAIGAARILERKAERRTAEGVPDARDPRLRTDPEAKDARGAVKALEPSAFDALSEKSSREERSTVWDEDVGVEEVAKSDENRAQDTAVDSRITEATERDAARECAVPDGERSRTRAQTPVSRGHALGSGMTSNLGNDGTDGRPTEGTGSSDVPRIPIAKPASDGLRSEPSSTGLGSETAPSDALRSGRETSSVRSSAETLHSPLDSTHPGGGVEFSEARQERLQENLAPSEVTTEIQNWGLTERPRVSSSLPVHDSLPAVGNPVSRASETSGSTERSPADTLRTDQRTEGGAKTREPTSKTESGAGTDEASTESEPQYGEHLEEILDELDLDLDGLEVAGEASARSAAAAAADGEGFEVHHEESHAQLFVPDESDIVEEAW